MKRDKIRIIIDEIFRIVINDMYITHNILHSFYYNLILSMNLLQTELMRKAYQLRRPNFICTVNKMNLRLKYL